MTALSQPLCQDPNIMTGLRAGSTNRCSGHVVPKVVRTGALAILSALSGGPCSLARPCQAHTRFATGCGPSCSHADLACPALMVRCTSCYYLANILLQASTNRRPCGCGYVWMQSDTLMCGSRSPPRRPAALRNAPMTGKTLHALADPSTLPSSRLVRPATEREISAR